MMLAMLVQTIYNLADGIWVAGLGPYALAAIGLFFPIFMVIISLAAGIGVGASSVVSQKIGERDKEGADTAASVSILFSIVIGFLSIAVILPFISDILIFAGAQGETLRLALEYSVILVYCISFPLSCSTT